MKNPDHPHHPPTARPDVTTLPSTTTRRIMRCIDVVGAAGLLVLFGPVMVVAALMVKLTSPGPVIYRQERVGYAGEPFEVLKFRTMTDGTHDEVLADPELRARYEQNDFKLPADDPRITAAGRWLRRTSLDELPQLWNVLRGEMGLVGVRPIERGEFVLRPTGDQALYEAFKPALTGRWQIAGRAELKGDARLELDRACLEQWSVRSNLVILAKTPIAVLRRAGAA